MSDLLTPIADFAQTQLEASRRISDALFTGTGKLDHAMLETLHHTLDAQMRFAQAIGNTRDLQTYTNLQSTFWASRPEEAQLFQKKLVQIVTETQNELGRAAQSYLEQMSARSMRGMPSQVFTAGERAFEPGINPFGGMMAAWQNAMRGMSSLADQAISTARDSTARAGMAAAQMGAQAVSEATTALAGQVSPEQSGTAHGGAEDEVVIDDSHDPARPHDGSESRSDQKRSGAPRRK